MKKIKVVLVEPMKEARIVEIGSELEDMQKLVGGYIEALPLENEVSIVCNEEAKLEGLKPNRGIFRDGQLVDIICGTFFVCATPWDSVNFESLTDEQATRIASTYKSPEMFFFRGRNLTCHKIGG